MFSDISFGQPFTLDVHPNLGFWWQGSCAYLRVRFQHAAPSVENRFEVSRNIFMTFAWYGHLKYQQAPLFKVILVSWVIVAKYSFQFS